MPGPIGQRSVIGIGGLALQTSLLVLGAWEALARAAIAADPLAVNKTERQTGDNAKQHEKAVGQAQRLIREAQQLEASGKTANAISVWEKAGNALRPLVGDLSERMARLHERLGQLQEKAEVWPAAEQSRAKVLAIRSKLYGEKDWRVTDARLALSGVQARSRLTRDQRRALLQAEEANSQVVALYGRGDYRQAIALAEQALDVRRRILGDRHPDTATSLNNLAGLYQSMGDYAHAEPLFRRALEIDKDILGEQHPDTATSLGNLALLYQAMGEYAKAEPLDRQALAISVNVLGKWHPDTATRLNNLALLFRSKGEYTGARALLRTVLEFRKKVLREKHPDTAQSLNNLAELYQLMGDYAKAEPLYRQALEICKTVLGQQHPTTATILNNLASLYESMGDYAKAEPLYRQALEIYAYVLGEMHPETAVSLNNLARLYESTGDYAKAEPLYEHALEIKKKVLGKEHPGTAGSLNNLAELYESMGDYAKAEPLYRQALEICQKTLGERHPLTATSLNNLAGLYQRMGDYAKAKPLYRQAFEIRKNVLGKRHPDTAGSLNNLALLYQSMGDYAKAEPLCLQALGIYEQHFANSMRVQSERQQLALAELLRINLDVYLSLTPEAHVKAADVYRHVLEWKGAVFMRQFAGRVSRRRPDLQPRFHELEAVSVRLSNLALRGPNAKGRVAWERQVAEFSDQKDALEAELSSKSAEFRQEQALLQLAPANLQQILPEHVALVDFLEYTRFSPPRGGKGRLDREQRIVAFVVRKDRPIVHVELGPVKPLAAAAEDWRRAILRDAGMAEDVTPQGTDPAHKLPQQILKELFWNPLQKPLEGAQTVLISPDGVLNQIPLAALPGQKAGSYLLEELKLVVVPVPRLVPLLLGAPRKSVTTAASAAESIGEQSLLIVGDVSYGGSPGKAEANLVAAGRSAVRGNRAGGLQFAELDSTRSEMATIRDSFEKDFPDGKVRPLRGDKATESAFRREAPKYRWLHLATHGFFAPPEFASALAPSKEDQERGFGEFARKGIAGSHPGLLSGIALSGANTPAGENEDDGILTAVEVAGLDLERVELVVLSACETGLGSVAGGEGVLGLQRAFQLAGAKTTVASLWKIPDRTTMQLMQRFYENLWDKKMSKIDALREAQIWMLKEGRQRGLDLEDASAKKRTSGRLPPRYWAAFVLSGDWR